MTYPMRYRMSALVAQHKRMHAPQARRGRPGAMFPIFLFLVPLFVASSALLHAAPTHLQGQVLLTQAVAFLSGAVWTTLMGRRA